MTDTKFKFDCIFFNGEKPCKFKRICHDCPEYKPFGTRILIIKLGAMGDVLRTTPILSALKAKYKPSHITWVTDPSALALIENNPLIDRIVPYSQDNIQRFSVEKFHLLICLDKETRATVLAENVSSEHKIGFGMNEYGSVRPLNPECEYTFTLGLSDQLKFFKNKKSYQEIIFEILKIPYRGVEYIISPGNEEKEYALALFSNFGLPNKRLNIGISAGAGHVFAKKAWKVEKFIKLIDRIDKELGDYVNIIILGGTREIDINKKITESARGKVYDSGCNNSLARFIGIVDECDVVISGDTLAMHLAIGLRKYPLALFGPTCPQEIDLYGRGKILTSEIPCAPCYRGKCDIEDDCMERLSIDTVYNSLKEIITPLLQEQQK